MISIENQPPAPNDRFKIEVQCKMLMGKFSPTSFDHTKTMLLPQFGSRWKVWNKYEIRGVHGSGGIGNGGNRDFGNFLKKFFCDNLQTPCSVVFLQTPCSVVFPQTLKNAKNAQA